MRNKLILVMVVVLFQCGHYEPVCECVRPQNWATPLCRPGLPNLYKVSNYLYRGGQPEKCGMEQLEKLEITTIINFSTSDKDQYLINEYKLKSKHKFEYIPLPMCAFLPDKEKFKQFLAIVCDHVCDPSKGKVFIHCKHGADRTGTAAALYRIKIDNWDTEEAIKEMVYGGYGFHKSIIKLQNFIRKF